MAPRLAIVRTHGAMLVSQLLNASAVAPTTSLALWATVINESQRAKRARCFQEVVSDLGGWLQGTVLDGPDADLEALVNALRPRQVVHLFAHGDAFADAPYSRSGLLLPSGGALPKRGWRAFHSDHVLSPRRLSAIDFGDHLMGSHVTLQACVSGHAQSNLRGDAIGIEWGFLLSGASSVLGSRLNHSQYATMAAMKRVAR